MRAVVGRHLVAPRRGLGHAPTLGIKRWAWSLTEAARRHVDLQALLVEMRKAVAAREPEWVLDLAGIEENFSAKLNPSVWGKDSPLIPRSLAPDTMVRLFSTLSTAGRAAQSVSLTVSSPAAALMVQQLFHDGNSDEAPWRLKHLHLTLFDAAFSRDSEGRALTSLPSFLAALARSSAALESLSVAYVFAGGLETRWEWDSPSTVALAAVVSSSAMTLRTLDLSYLPLAIPSEAAGGETSPVEALADAIASCANLEVLSLRGQQNFLSRSSLLRTGLERLARLEELDVSFSALDDVSMVCMLHALKASIGGWCRLQSFGIAQCGLSAYSVGIMARHTLEVVENVQEHGTPPATTGASNSIGPRISSLNVASNALGKDREEAFSLSTALTACKALAVLNMRHNALTPRSVSTALSGLARTSGLERLHLHSNRLGDSGLMEILTHGKHWTRLVELDLTRCRLTSLGLLQLARAMPQWEHLTTLTLARNDLRRSDLRSAADALRLGREASGEERPLHLFAFDPAFMQGDSANRNRGTEKVPTSYELDRRDAEVGRHRYKGTEHFEDTAQDPLQLRTLSDLSPFIEFGEALCACRNLRALDLADCLLADSEAFAAVATGLKAAPLTRLSLAANPLFRSEANVQTLAAALQFVAAGTLEVLDLSFTALDDLGVVLLCEGSGGHDPGSDGGLDTGLLPHMERLVELHLSSCSIQLEGAKSLATALPSMRSLRRLFLTGNQLGGAEGMSALLAALETLPNFEFVGLHSPNAPCSATAAIMKSSAAYSSLVRRGVTVHL